MHYQGNQQRKTRKKGRSIRNIFQNTLFIFCYWNSDLVDNVTLPIREHAIGPILPYFRIMWSFTLRWKKKKHLKPLGRKLKLVHVQCGTNVLTYPWAKIVDNLVANYANCGSQGSPVHKTSYIRSSKFKQFSTRRRHSEKNTSLIWPTRK